MSTVQPSLWGIVSAGGEKERLKDIVHERIGTIESPKKICVFEGTVTMPRFTA